MKVTVIPGTPAVPEHRVELHKEVKPVGAGRYFINGQKLDGPYEKTILRERVVAAVPAVEDKVVIECSRKQAQLLRDLVGSAVGVGVGHWRDVNHSVWVAFCDAGFREGTSISRGAELS